MASTVTKGVTWVKPAAPCKGETVILSAADNQSARVYPCAFWFFPENKDQKSFEWHCERVKRGLARVLYQQPLMMGVIKENERGVFRIEIPPEGENGGNFHFQDVSNDPTFPSMAQIAAANYPVIDGLVDGFDRLRPEKFPTSTDGDPVMIVQFTKLKGGMVVFASCTHLVGDLLQPRMALGGLAEQTQLVADALVAGEPEPDLPDRFPDVLYDRSPLTPPKTKDTSFKEAQAICDKWGAFFILDPTDPIGAAKRMKETFPEAYLTPEEEKNEAHLRAHIGGMWKIKLKNLEFLKTLAQKNTDKNISTVDTVMAFLWQRFYSAKYAVNYGKDACPDRPKLPAFVFPADIRRRLNPPLPQFYLGAAVDIFKAQLPESEFLPQNDSEQELGRSLASAAWAIRFANTQFVEERYRELMREYANLPHHVPFLPSGPLDVLCTDHTRNTGLREADWGHGLGKTPELRQPYFGRDMPPGELTLMPRFSNGDMEIMMTSERIVLERLDRDPLFKKYADLVFMAYNAREALVKQNSTPRQQMARL